MKKNATLIGTKYKKAIFVEYTDETFTVKKPRPESEKYLGLLGPVLRANIGSNITVVFKNLASRPYSLHGYGMKYAKDSEGFSYADSEGKGGFVTVAEFFLVYFSSFEYYAAVRNI